MVLREPGARTHLTLEGQKIESAFREAMKAKTGTYAFVVKEQPHEAGVDPLSFLADRIPADNLKKITGL